MRIPIYEALAHYKKNEELPYTEYFGLGFFSDISLAEEALVESAHIGDDINYEIVNNKIYGVWYDYDIDSYYSSSGHIGLFSTLEYAEKALKWYKTWDIFKVHGLEYLGIDIITLNLRGWTEGFITVYD